MPREFTTAILLGFLSLWSTFKFGETSPQSNEAALQISCPTGTHQVRAAPVHTESDHALACADTQGVWAGPYQERFNDDTVAVRGIYLGGQPNGSWTFFYKGGATMMSGSFRSGKREGIWTSFYENGHKLGQGPYHNDDLDGHWINWYEDGTRKSEGSYKSGDEWGLWSFWYANGRLQKRGKYFGRRIVPPRNASVPAESGLWTYWYEKGLKQMEGSYRKGERMGEWTEWSEDGSITSHTRFPTPHESAAHCL